MPSTKIIVWVSCGPQHKSQEVVDLVYDWGHSEEDALAYIANGAQGNPVIDREVDELAMSLLDIEIGAKPYEG